MKPDYIGAKKIGRRFYNNHCNGYPIDPIQIIYDMGWKFDIDNLEGEEGYTFKNAKTGNYKIIIDTNHSKHRCKFTIAHEIGHIILGHYTKYNLINLSDNLFYILDKEADIVAGEILMPYIYLNKMHNYNLDELAYFFDVSKSAMQTRLNFIRKNNTQNILATV